MFTSEPPPHAGDPDAVLQYLRVPIMCIDEALAGAILDADEVVPPESGDFDPWLWAHFTRHRARRTLQSMDLEDGWLVDSLPMSGILVGRGSYAIRVLRRAPGGPPSPGRNRARRAYWSQQLSLFGSESASGNLILDWDAGAATREPILHLSMPRGIWKFQGVPKVAWRFHIAHPSGYSGLRFDPAEDDELDVAPIDEAELGEGGAEEAGA